MTEPLTLAQRFHPDVLAAHAEFGGDLESMQALYDRPDHLATITRLTAANKALTAERDSAKSQLEHLGKLASEHRDELEAKLAKVEAELVYEKEAHRLTRVSEYAKISYRDKRFAQMGAANTRLSAELAEARTLLEPFAKEAKRWDGYSDEEHLVESWPGGPSSGLTVSHLLAARSFLASKEASHDE